jgi:hypothetical protein
MNGKICSVTPNLAISASGFLFLTSTGETFTANDTGRAILSTLQAGAQEDQIIERLISEFEVDRRAAQRDVQDFLAQLRQYRLLVEKDPV